MERIEAKLLQLDTTKSGKIVISTFKYVLSTESNLQPRHVLYLIHAAGMLPHCNMQQHTATHCNTLQQAATHCNTMQAICSLDIFAAASTRQVCWHTATHSNTLQHSATLCNTLQHTATSTYSLLYARGGYVAVC